LRRAPPPLPGGRHVSQPPVRTRFPHCGPGPNLAADPGLGHRGTTILDLILGQLTRACSAGAEGRVDPLSRSAWRRAPGDQAQLRLELRHAPLCTCGATAAQCSALGRLLEWLRAIDERRSRQTAAGCWLQVQGLSPRPSRIHWAVDSFRHWMRPLLPLPGVEVRMIHLVRRTFAPGALHRPGLRALPLGRWRSLCPLGPHQRAVWPSACRRSAARVPALGTRRLAWLPERALRKVLQLARARL